MTVFVTQPKQNTASMTSNFWPGKVIKGASFVLPRHVIFFWPLNTNILGSKTETKFRLLDIRKLGVCLFEVERGWFLSKCFLFEDLGSKTVIINIYFKI